MKTYDILPTPENIRNSYLEDSIGRNQDIFYFINILDSVEGNCSIALEGNWGCGKTFFVKQTQMIVEANNDFLKSETFEEKQAIKNKQYGFWGKDFTLKPQVCIYYDAWENDNDEDPILSLIYTIMQTVTTDYNFKKRDYIKIGTTILDNFLGTNWEK